MQVDERGYRRYWDEERETLDPRLRERLILERVRHQVAYVYDRLPFYRRHYDAHGFHPDQARSLEDFTTKVPITTKKMLVADQREHPVFGSYAGEFAPDDLARIHGSTGTSGTPTLYCVSKQDWERSAERVALAVWAMGARPCDTAQIGYPFSLFFGGWVVLQGLEKLGCTIFPLGVLDSERHLDLMGRVGATIFSATPSYTHLWRESQPMIRFWPGDETYMVHDGPTSCGRTYPRLPEGIVGRLDDMLIIRGANVYPSAVESVLRGVYALAYVDLDDGPRILARVPGAAAAPAVGARVTLTAPTPEGHAAVRA